MQVWGFLEDMIRVEKWKHVLAAGVGCKDLCHNFAHVDMVK